MVAGEQWEAELPDLGKVLVLIPFSTLTLFELDYNKENSITVLLEGFDNRDGADHDDSLEARQEDDHHQDEVQSGLFGSGDLAKFP